MKLRMDERRRLHGLTIEQLQNELQETQAALVDFRFDAGLNRLTNPAGLHNSRKRIAVLKTIIREKELLASSGFNTMDEYKSFKAAERRAYHASKTR